MKTATTALMNEFGLTCRMHTTLYDEFCRAVERGETPIPIAFVEQDYVVLASVTFDPKTCSMAVTRDSSVDPILQKIYHPSYMLPLIKDF